MDALACRSEARAIPAGYSLQPPPAVPTNTRGRTRPIVSNPASGGRRLEGAGGKEDAAGRNVSTGGIVSNHTSAEDGPSHSTHDTHAEPVDPLVADTVHKLCAWDGENAAVGHALVAGMDAAAADNYAVRFAASQGHAHVVKLLCDLAQRGQVHVDVSSRNNEALRQAACHGHFSVVRLLCGLPLELGVDPAACGNEAVLKASANGHVDVVRLLCALPRRCGVDVAVRQNACICLASQNGHAEVVRLKLDTY